MTNYLPTNTVSRRTALAGLGAGALGLAVTVPRFAVAVQEATPEMEILTRGHPLVGAWEVNESDGNAAPIDYAVFDADGSWIHVARGGLSIGVWRPTGERTAEGVEFYAFFNDLGRLFDLASPVPADALQQPPLKFRFDAEVDAGGNAFRISGYVVDEEGKDDLGSAGSLAGVRLEPAEAAATPPA